MRIYISKQGDTVQLLAEKYDITPEELIAMNDSFEHGDQFSVGTKIRVPATVIPSSDYEIMHKHIVKEGDCLRQLSKAWGVPLQTMIEANPQLKKTNILIVGQVINIPRLQGESHLKFVQQKDGTEQKEQEATLQEEAAQPRTEMTESKIETGITKEMKKVQTTVPQQTSSNMKSSTNQSPLPSYPMATCPMYIAPGQPIELCGYMHHYYPTYSNWNVTQTNQPVDQNEHTIFPQHNSYASVPIYCDPNTMKGYSSMPTAIDPTVSSLYGSGAVAVPTYMVANGHIPNEFGHMYAYPACNHPAMHAPISQLDYYKASHTSACNANLYGSIPQMPHNPSGNQNSFSSHSLNDQSRQEETMQQSEHEQLTEKHPSKLQGNKKEAKELQPLSLKKSQKKKGGIQRKESTPHSEIYSRSLPWINS